MKPLLTASRAAAVLALLALASTAAAQDPPQPVDPHAAHGQKPAEANESPAQPLPPFIPPVTDDDRKAAFPDVDGHTVHDRAVHYFMLFDQLEWQASDGDDGVGLDGEGWVGGDLDRLWIRTTAHGRGDSVADASAQLLYGRHIARWWDLVAGVRQDVRPDGTTWFAIGLQGLAPYWFDVEATAYVGAGGRTQANVEVEYELLFTNRLVLQPRVEIELAGKADPEHRLGSGLTATDLGFRLRYEWRREIAPYIGLSYTRRHGATGDFAEASGEPRGRTKLVTGLRVWF